MKYLIVFCLSLMASLPAASPSPATTKALNFSGTYVYTRLKGHPTNKLTCIFTPSAGKVGMWDVSFSAVWGNKDRAQAHEFTGSAHGDPQGLITGSVTDAKGKRHYDFAANFADGSLIGSTTEIISRNGNPRRSATGTIRMKITHPK